MHIPKSLIILIFIGISTISRFYAQVSIVLNVKLDELSLSGTSQWFISITNSSSKPLNVYLHAYITVPTEGIIADGTSKSFSLKPFETRIDTKTGAELADSSKIDYDGAYMEWYMRTNELPSRKYSICVEVLETGSGASLAQTCQEVEPQKFRPPVNIYPFDRDTINSNNLSFQWLPSQPYNPEFTYSLRVVEVLSIQSPLAAFSSNNFYYSEDFIMLPFLQFPVNARNLEEGQTYAWLVEGKMGNLTLKSEPTLFVVGKPIIPVPKPVTKPKGTYTQYIDLMSASAREIQFAKDDVIPLMIENNGAPYNLIYCITGSAQNILVKGKIPVPNGLNKLQISTAELKPGLDEIFYLKLFRAEADLPEIRFKLINPSTLK